MFFKQLLLYIFFSTLCPFHKIRFRYGIFQFQINPDGFTAFFDIATTYQHAENISADLHTRHQQHCIKKRKTVFEFPLNMRDSVYAEKS